MSEFFDRALVEAPLTKKEFKARVPELRAQLLQAQLAMRDANVPLMVIFAGVDGGGKHELINLLNAWMAPRWMVTRAYGKPSGEERERPTFWRYWRDLPATGQTALFLSAWHSKPLLDRVKRGATDEKFDVDIADINHFERTLVDNGMLILKFWMHLGEKCQLKRLKKLGRSSRTAWQIRPGAWQNWGMYSKFIEVSEQLIRRTDYPDAPWQIVDGSDNHGRAIQVAETILQAVQKRVNAQPKPVGLPLPEWRKTHAEPGNILANLDMTQRIEQDAYKERLEDLQAELYQLQHQANVNELSTVLVFEGWDAGGKGGAIRRLVQGLDAREFEVIPIAAPTEEEHRHHYLWRFWRHLPRAGRVTIFDRSWYGRLLVERIEGFATPAEWQQAYHEINEFEQQLLDRGTVLCKFWLQITKEEQLARFNERLATPYKHWKITDEDWRNRERWDDYEIAVHDMVTLTSPQPAPWTLVESNQKEFARLKVLETVCAALRAGLEN